MSNAELIWDAIRETTRSNDAVEFKRAAIQTLSKVAPASFGSVFQHMSENQPGGAPRFQKRLKGILTRLTKHGWYALSPAGRKLLRNEGPALVRNYEQALESARMFQNVGQHRDSIAYKVIGHFSHWYYFEEIDGFAPSKFSGYRGTTLLNYDSSDGKGTETNKALNELFVAIPRPSQAFDIMAERLSDWLAGKKARLSQKTLQGPGGIYVRSESENAMSTIQQNGSDDQSQNPLFIEGMLTEVRQSKFERDPRARTACLKHFGYHCQACHMDFEKRYGALGRAFIHVHHLEPLSTTRTAGTIDPQKDLVPLCPNCHAMIHRLNSPQPLIELQTILAGKKRRFRPIN